MTSSPDLDSLRAGLRRRGQLLTLGESDRALHGAVERGELVRLSQGWYIDREHWHGLKPEQQHLARAMCAHGAARTPPVFSHYTAAAILGLPLLEFDTTRVHALLPARSTRPSSGGVVRHHHDLPPDEVQRTSGLQHTDLRRTLIDIARYAPFASGMVAGDAAMRRLLRGSILTLEQQRALLLEHLASLPAARGARRARNVLNVLDGGAESPLESLFRLQLLRLGFEVRTQVPVRLPNGRRYRMDLELVGLRVFFEADGRAKYLDEGMRGGRSVGEVLIDERDRENLVSGTTGYRVLRGRWEHAQSPGVLATRLRGFGITPPIDLDRRSRLHLY